MEVHGTNKRGNPSSPLIFDDRAAAVRSMGGRFAEAVKRGRCFATANQVGVTSQAGLSVTTPVLTLLNPLGSKIIAEIWKVTATFTVAPATAGAVWLAHGTNTVVPAGTLSVTTRNCNLGAAQNPGISVLLAATLPIVPVAIDILGCNLTGAITTIGYIESMSAWYDGGTRLLPGNNISIQTQVASGAAGLACAYIWEEVDE